MAGRLTTSLYVNALMRAVGAEGGFGFVLAKGDADAGAVLLVTRENGRISGAFEPRLAPEGHYPWARIMVQSLENEAEFQDFLNLRRARDPDLWIIELDIPDSERFIAQYPREA